MKNIKILSFLLALLAIPFLSKAQFNGGGSIHLTVNAAGHDMTVAASTNVISVPGATILANTSYTFNATKPSGYTGSFFWQTLVVSYSDGSFSQILDVPTLENQAIGVPSNWYYVPKSPSGTAPIYSVVKNSTYNYTITINSIPQ